MQCFKLVNGGFVDKVIVFDSLPERLIKNVRTREPAGFPRSWAKWLGDIGSLRTVFKTDTTVDMARNYTFTHTPIGQEPCFFMLEYQDINADKERWREIGDYLRAHVGQAVRLTEKIEDMAVALAPDSYKGLSIEYEDIPVIPLPPEVEKAPELRELVKPGETILVTEQAPKKRGRPKKVAVEA